MKVDEGIFKEYSQPVKHIEFTTKGLWFVKESAHVTYDDLIFFYLLHGHEDEEANTNTLKSNYVLNTEAFL